jgi:hypothetical protein
MLGARAIPFLGFVPSLAAICCSLLHPKGKKRATSLVAWLELPHERLRRAREPHARLVV